MLYKKDIKMKERKASSTIETASTARSFPTISSTICFCIALSHIPFCYFSGQFCSTLFGREIEVIRGEGRKGKINFVMLFPSLHSYRSLVLDLIRRTTGLGHKTIAFSNSHLGLELLAFYLSRQGIKIKVHRAGLLPSVRKGVEQSFKDDKLMAISATPRLIYG